jgi:hypothetical protein
VYLVIVFLSVILHMLLLSSKLKRNLIVSLNLTGRIFYLYLSYYFIDQIPFCGLIKSGLV